MVAFSKQFPDIVEPSRDGYFAIFRLLFKVLRATGSCSA